MVQNRAICDRIPVGVIKKERPSVSMHQNDLSDGLAYVA